MTMTAKDAKIERGWDLVQVKTFVNEAINAHREAWTVVPSVRRAIIAERFSDILRGQSVETLSTAKIEQLWQDMFELARKLGAEA